MKVYTETSVEIFSNPENVFDKSTELDMMPKVFKGFGLIPAIIKVELAEGNEVKEGCIRKIHNSDKSILDEKVITFKRPQRQTYQLIKGFTFPNTLLVTLGEGDWIYTPTEKGTLITWKYYFELTSPAVFPIGYLVVKLFMNKAMHNCLLNLKKIIENK